ncbi:MAG TPA: hypothetical protein VGD66_10460 [Allosphingosinicella sp.]|jgi:hypothetical protein
MSLRLVAMALILLPSAALAEKPPKPAANDDSYRTKKICTVETQIGTRLGQTMRCRTRAEAKEAKLEQQRVVQRIQDFKPTMCPPDC